MHFPRGEGRQTTVENRMVILEVKDKVIEIKPFSAEEIVERWEKMSEKEDSVIITVFPRLRSLSNGLVYGSWETVISGSGH